MKHFIKPSFNIAGKKNLLEKNKNFNIAYGVDKNFLLGAAISINSVLINNIDTDFNFHLFTDYIDDEYIQRFQKMITKYNSNIIIYLLDAEELKQLSTSDFWSYATYFRLIAFEYLSTNINSILYLDADVICKGNLKELFQLNLANSFAAVVLDVNNMQQSSATRLKLTDLNGKYFNAGVIYVNLKKWIENDLSKKSLELVRGTTNFGKLKYLDQDALNILFQTQNIYLSRDYNCIYTLKNELAYHDLSKYKNTITDSTILIHYTGVTKPWHTWGINYPASQFFFNSYIHSPWKDQPLKIAEKRTELQEKYKHLFLQHKYVHGLLCLIKYKLLKK
ncbi:lipopolysaccharide 1,2-glucosyltransferase [Arsenophonus endosymbiont of Aphis craccivora]|uniref:glycosyltransferase family 8 protein n=1 Tax=Arsenophonus endosymbiont of Aphis craccivora TaxID=1231049 RepID=UPI0015DCFCBF|nr:lipopolysaccharide 1,2-glucosyltransferase [Arsenophonus endosymbiont of Aphis craccivora]